VRAVLVGVLILAVSAHAFAGHQQADWVTLWPLFALLFLIELVGGPVISSGQILMTDLFSDRRLYARALGLGTMSEQVNQAIGLTLGGFVVAWVGSVRGLWFDLATFLISALVITLVTNARAVLGTPSAGLAGFFRDIGEGATYLYRQPVLMSLLALSLCSAWAVAAPEAVALAYAHATDSSGAARLGGLLMAAPVFGAVTGLVIVGRWQPERQNSRLIVMALLMPLPLMGTMFVPVGADHLAAVVRVRGAAGIHAASVLDVLTGRPSRDAWQGLRPRRCPLVGSQRRRVPRRRFSRRTHEPSQGRRRLRDPEHDRHRRARRALAAHCSAQGR